MLAGLFRLSFFLLRNFFACEFLLCAVVLNSCFLKRFIDQPPLSFVELFFFSLKIPPRKDGILPLESEDTCLCKPIDWSMAAMLRDSVVVVRTRPRAIPLAMIAIRKILHGFPFPSRDAYGALLGSPSGRRSSAIMPFNLKDNVCVWMDKEWLQKSFVLLWTVIVVAAMVLMTGLYSRIVFALWFKRHPENQLTFQQRVSINKQVQQVNIFLLLF